MWWVRQSEARLPIIRSYRLQRGFSIQASCDDFYELLHVRWELSVAVKVGPGLYPCE
jgi:hypothetical protein